MKKKVYMLLACTAMSAMLLGGCGGTTDEPTTDEPAIEQEAQEPIVEDGSLPLLTADLQKLYETAQSLYDEISFGKFNVSEEEVMTVNGIEYKKVVDDRFATYDAFQAYLEQYFTKDFVATTILNEGNILFAKGEDGSLYTLGGGRGANIYYAGHVFNVDRETDNEIDFTATVYYINSAEAYTDDLFYAAPENPDEFTTQEYKFILLQEEDTWKFDEFSLFY